MDIGATEDSDYEASGRASSEDADTFESELPKNVTVETIQSPRSSPSKDAQTAKWLRLRKHHNSKYLNLFRDSWEVTDDWNPSENLVPSQIGAVIWQPSEKGRLFTALARYGSTNMKLLAKAVESKGELEIHAYLNALRQGDLERQLFHRHTQNATQIDMPAAIEIGDDIESALDRAAEALSAYQEQYDYAVAARASDQEYVIDSEVATVLDARADTNGDAVGDVTEDRDLATSYEPHEMFRTSRFCELSRNIFMRGTRDDPTNNWMNHAEAGESPSLTRDAVSDFHDLVVSLSQRIIQTTIFITESRLRSTTTTYWKPSSHVRLEDVESALDILNMKQSLSDYWLKFPRRCGLKIISGSHRKGASKKEYLSVDEAERRLSMPTARGRHSRSSSRAVESNRSENTDANSRHSSPESMSVDEGAGTSSDDSDNYEVDASASESDGSENIETDGVDNVSAPISRSKRRRLLEEEQDIYMEELDRKSRRAEEQYLVSELDLHNINLVKEEEEDEHPRKRPKVLRKTVEDVRGWRAPSLAVWEAYDLQSGDGGHDDSIEEPIDEDTSMVLEQPDASVVDADSDSDDDEQSVGFDEASSPDDEE